MARSKVRAAEWARQRYDRNRAVVNWAKSRPCVDCGVSYPPYVMQLDHRDPKTKLFTIGASLNSRNLDAVVAEVEKCDPVCANCPSTRTWRSLQARGGAWNRQGAAGRAR
jgi:hypothetical protein